MIKKILLSAVVVVSGMAMIGCNRDDDRINRKPEEPKTEVMPLKAFSLETTEVSLKKGETVRIKITSGNEDYSAGFSNLVQPIPLIVRVSSDNQYIEVIGLRQGFYSTLITDIKSNKRIKLTIKVM